MVEGRTLKGMEQIAKYANRGEADIIQFVRQEGFPAQKIGGVWMAHTVEIDRWWRRKLQGRPAVDIEHLAEIIHARSRLGKDASERLAKEIAGEI